MLIQPLVRQLSRCEVIGLVLAAGAGRRLHHHTRHVPKALLEVAEGVSILDVVLANLSAAAIGEVVIVTGFQAQEVAARVETLQRRHQVEVRTIFNDRALDWNNAYSLWLARDWFDRGALLCNGDTVHPPSVEQALLRDGTNSIRLAVDAHKRLAHEEMKVVLDDAGRMRRINKSVPPADASAEYIGVSLISPGAASDLAAALEDTWQRDPGLYYEDGFQAFVDAGGDIEVSPIGAVEWVEVDDERDLLRARDIACRF